MGLVVDLFAGGGGASVGIEAALSRRVDVAINHSPIALAVHKLNHPATRHLEADIWDVRPADATGGEPVDLLWASPDCTHFSVAKGDVPRDQGIRSLAWAVVGDPENPDQHPGWAREVRPAVICIENVREFQGWGPLGDDGRPCRRRVGTEFDRWTAALRGLGYAVEWRMLDAAAFGAPTRRRRLFIVARCDGQPIRWPDATHGPGLLPERTAAECIDWSLPCPSIFERKRPLAEKTLARIAEGIRRYVLEAAEPFLIQTGYGERPGQVPRVPGLDKPLGTVVAGGSKHALVAAFLAKHYGGVVGHELGRPIGTVTATDHHALTAASLVKFRGTSASHHGAADPRRPMPTVSAGGTHVAEVRAFLTAFYSSGSTGQRVLDPMRTITAKHRLGLVTVHGQDYQIVDVGMRMLEPHELLAAQFGRFAAGYRLDAKKRDRFGRLVPVSKADRVRLIGNSVAPEVAQALVAANCRADLAEAAA